MSAPFVQFPTYRELFDWARSQGYEVNQTVGYGVSTMQRRKFRITVSRNPYRSVALMYPGEAARTTAADISHIARRLGIQTPWDPPH